METRAKNTAAAAVTQEEQEPPSNKNQHLGHQGRTESPSLRRVLVYDCERKTVHVQSEKSICQWLPPRIVHVSMELRNATVSDPRSYNYLQSAHRLPFSSIQRQNQSRRQKTRLRMGRATFFSYSYILIVWARLTRSFGFWGCFRRCT